MAETQGDKLRKKLNQEASKASKRKNYQNPMKMERRKEGFRSKNPKVKFMDEMDAMTKGLKTLLIAQVKSEAESQLNKTDWYITRKAEKNTAIPSAISTHRDAVRTKQAEMETAITNASDTPALETLYTYTIQEDGSVTRPIGEIPRLED